MLRQSVYGGLAGYKDVNDAERLRVGPVMRRGKTGTVGRSDIHK